ncbi:MAG: hypothetical protein DHS20C15_24930 [Planctomycetota bacterium]|nr:MAG: hypothetical protein DHS20C15_24930 [Planctomycetota bacterium]
MWECSECLIENDLDPDAEEGQILICMECDAEFEILTLEPLELERLELVEDDDDDGGSIESRGWDEEE